MKVFVTGSTGLLGSFIAEKLLVEGYELICSKRPTSSLAACASFEDKVRWVDLDILDHVALLEQVKNVDWVVHCAALVSFNAKDFKELDEANRIGTQNIVDVCLENGVPNLFYVSSIAALGRVDVSAKIDEETKWESSALNSAYAISKYLAECEVWRGEQEGLNVSVINPSVILGPGDTTRSSTQLFEFTKKYKGIYPTGFLNVVDVRDVADVSVELIKQKVVGERFIVSAAMLSYKELLRDMAIAFGLKVPTFCFSKRLAWLVYPFFKLLSWVTGRPSFLTKQSIKLMDLRSVYDSSKLEKRLSFDYRNWKDTVKWTCEELN